MDVRQWLTENLPLIINYALIIISYILYFIAGAIVRKSRKSLGTLFTEKSKSIETGNKMMRADVEEDLRQAKLALAEAKAKYDEVNDRLVKTEKMLAALIDVEIEEVENAVPDNGTVEESIVQG